MSNLEKCLNGIAAELAAIDPNAVYDYYIDNVLDIEFTVDAARRFISARLYITIGGPSVWIDTRTRAISGVWGLERATVYSNSDALVILASYAEEDYNSL